MDALKVADALHKQTQLQEHTVTGTLVETGSDFEFAHGGSASPSVWVKALSVAGE